MVLHGNSIPTPRYDIGKHLGNLLDSTDGSDVPFVIDGETFHAHRAVLAARSPVFNVELLGSMAEATMSSITLHDIAPATFRLMLRFMYTDVFPGDDELGDSPSEIVQHLLAAADLYALDGLKLMCAQKLWDNVSVDTVADALACADMYNCQELKNRCLGFVVDEKNFKKVVLTEGFKNL
ncbi:BTB/POZ and MATH domain-containing protein 1 [Setaria viridis]|nr:BTB/POZ and MATH domain-containing protein 1-like [Setaria viridis]